jgi:hypothetical protein
MSVATSTAFLASYIALWVLVGVLALAILALYHHFGVMYLGSREGREDQGPSPGTRLERRTLEDVQGQPLVLPPPDAPALLLFTATDCTVCARLLEDLPQFVRRHDDLETIVVCAGTRPAVRECSRDLVDLVPVVPELRSRLTASYDIALAPWLVGVDAEGVVCANGLVNEGDGLELAATEMSVASAEMDLTRTSGGGS